MISRFLFIAIHAESAASGKSDSYRSTNANDMEVVETPLNPFVRGEFFEAVLLKIFPLPNDESFSVNFVSPGSPAEAAVSSK